MKAYDIVAYDYRGEMLCPEDTLKALLSPAEFQFFGDLPTEKTLDFVAERKGIDRQDENSFDSGDFPKVVFANQLDGDDRCDACGNTLVGGTLG